MEIENSQPNLKRKRGVPEKPEADESKIAGKLHHGLKEIRKAAKKAKVFETQKLLRRTKALRQKDESSTDVVEHEAQLEILKAIEHEVVANSAIKSKIMKDHVLSQMETVRDALQQEIGDNILPSSPPPATSKIHSRLLSSKLLAQEISTLVECLRKLTDKPKKSRTEVEELTTSQNTEESPVKGQKYEKLPEIVKKISDKNKNPAEEDSWESGTVDEEPDVSGWESGSIHEENSESSDDENGREERTKVKEAAASSKIKRTNQRKPNVQEGPSNANSQFLPSLSVGFIKGGDDSDWSDSEAKLADTGVKKNRRGQRARRAIWEKKYGRNANHKKSETQQQNTFAQNDGNKWQTQRGPNQTRQGYGNERSNERATRTAPAPSYSTARNIPPKPTERPLHPSWEAKRKLKEKESAGIVPSQGVKIKFSD